MTRRTSHRPALSCSFTVVILMAIQFFSNCVADGQTVLYEDDFAAGIQNLRINNLCYDVEFVDGSYQSVYADAAPVFLNQPASANAAANKIRDVLNANRRVPEINESDNEVLWIPNERVSRSEFQAAQVGHDKSTDPWQRYGDFQGTVAESFEPWDFARFTEGPDVIYAANTGHAVGINNLRLEGACIDVRFAEGSFEDVYASHSPRYIEIEPQGNDATNAIMKVLNAEKPMPEINDSDNEVLWVPTDRTRSRFEAEQVGHDDSASPWKRFADFSGVSNVDWEAWEFAVFDQSLDCNRDGKVDIFDMNCACGQDDLGQAILSAIESVPGDLDGNGNVSFADFLELSENYGENGDYTDGDLNCDGTIAFADFLILSQNFGEGGSPGPLLGPIKITPVPEPGGFALALLTLPSVLLVVRSRRARSN